MASSQYGEQRLWDIATNLIDEHGIDKITADAVRTADLIRASTPNLSEADVAFVAEIIYGEAEGE